MNNHRIRGQAPLASSRHDVASQIKSVRKRKPKRLRELNDPIKTGILVFLVLVLVLASIATFTGGLLAASTNIKASVTLLAAFALTLRMEYDIIKRLLDSC